MRKREALRRLHPEGMREGRQGRDAAGGSMRNAHVNTLAMFPGRGPRAFKVWNSHGQSVLAGGS